MYAFSKKHRAEHVMENTDMPNTLVKKVSGVVVLEQTLPRVRFYVMS